MTTISVQYGYRFDPTDEELISYFLWKRIRGTRPKRVVAGKDNGGFWRANGGDKPVLDSENKQIGVKRILTFVSFKNRGGNREEIDNSYWIMHEYSFDSPTFQTWVLCRIKYKGKDKGSNVRKRYVHNMKIVLEGENSKGFLERMNLEEEERWMRGLVVAGKGILGMNCLG
ncbi:NAC transcription factor 56-like [Carica papaya]|uniref:NAC transcription factor 56-like n=1 Tax=Carica papaya TaxID=3649 RepID=UPI000B8C6EBC|nr:NAC transcription factor 56-like [Carica papaya]